MPVDVVLPKVDMDMETGVIAAWKVADGAFVRNGDILFDMETSKSIMEVEAPATGVVRNLAPVDGAALAVGTVVAVIVEEGAAHGDAAPGGSIAPGTAAASATSAASSANVGANAAPPSDAAAPASPATPGAHTHARRPADAAHAQASASGLRATPYARNLARSQGVALAAVPGTGPRGRIGSDDVIAHVHAQAPAAEGVARPALQEVPGDAAGRLVPFSPARRIAARRLAQSVQTAPHFYLTAHVDMGALRDALSGAMRAIRRRSGAAPTMTVVLAHLAARTLLDHPLVNASVEGEAMRLHDAVNIGVAMDRDGDLVVPVLRDAGRRSLGELAAEFRRLRDAVRSRTILPADLRGATFTVSSLEMYGVDAYTAIIDPPQSAILAVGRTVDTPVGSDGQVVLRPMATLTLSSDHRVVDGVTAARFMADLRRAIESPGPLA